MSQAFLSSVSLPGDDTTPLNGWAHHGAITGILGNHDAKNRDDVEKMLD